MAKEDIPYQPPAWLQSCLTAIEAVGYSTGDDAESFAEHYARGTDAVATEYFQLMLEDPDAAIEQIPTYLNRFGDINNNPNFGTGILNRITTEQFGVIINIASLRYENMEESQRHRILALTADFLGGKNSMNIPGYTNQLRNPELLHDLTAHWNVYWPFLYEHQKFLMGANWDDVRRHIDYHGNNPIMFALAVPLATTPPDTRRDYQQEFPCDSDKGVKIIASMLLCHGAHQELLRDKGMGNYTRGWEEVIYEALNNYGEEYRVPILTYIASGKIRIVSGLEVGIKEIEDKIINTHFLLDENGRLVRLSLQ